MIYNIKGTFDQGQLRWIALQAQKGKCVCGGKVNLQNGQLHHALLSRKDVVSHPEKDRINHPYNVLMLHDKCHENITRRIACQTLSRIYGYQNVLEWYNSFIWESSFRKLEEYNSEI